MEVRQDKLFKNSETPPYHFYSSFFFSFFN